MHEDQFHHWIHQSTQSALKQSKMKKIRNADFSDEFVPQLEKIFKQLYHHCHKSFRKEDNPELDSDLKVSRALRQRLEDVLLDIAQVVNKPIMPESRNFPKNLREGLYGLVVIKLALGKDLPDLV